MHKLDKSIIDSYNKTREIRKKRPLCRAPYSNLYFSKNGDVLACCFNRTNIFGKYPHDSLSEIWEGDKIRRFRSELKSNILPFGCDICQTEMEKSNFLAVTARRMDMLKIKHGYPVSIEFELDNTCNLECVMCEGIYSSSIRKNVEKKPPIISPYDDSFIDYISPFLKHAHILRFGGGEPFLIEIYYKIWDRFLELNKKGTVFIQTNGTVLTDRIREYLMSGRFTLGVSIDSMDKEVFESIRLKANYDKVLNNILEFNSLIPEKTKFSRLLLSITIMRKNWKDIPKVIDFACEIGAQVGLNTVWTPENHAIFNLPLNELIEIQDYYRNYQMKDGKSWIYEYNRNAFSGILKQIEGWVSEKQTQKDLLQKFSNYTIEELEKYLSNKIDNKTTNITIIEKYQSLINKSKDLKLYKDYLVLIAMTPVETIIENLESREVDDLFNAMVEIVERKKN